MDSSEHFKKLSRIFGWLSQPKNGQYQNTPKSQKRHQSHNCQDSPPPLNEETIVTLDPVDRREKHSS